MLERIDGGGDSMFKAILACIQEYMEDSTWNDLEIGSHGQLRKLLVQYIIDNSKKFFAKWNAKKRIDFHQ